MLSTPLVRVRVKRGKLSGWATWPCQPGSVAEKGAACHVDCSTCWNWCGGPEIFSFLAVGRFLGHQPAKQKEKKAENEAQTCKPVFELPACVCKSSQRPQRRCWWLLSHEAEETRAWSWSGSPGWYPGPFGKSRFKEAWSQSSRCPQEFGSEAAVASQQSTDGSFHGPPTCFEETCWWWSCQKAT